MPLQTINIGAAANDGTGDDARTAGGKINANFTFLESEIASSVSGDVFKSGTPTSGQVAVWVSDGVIEGSDNIIDKTTAQTITAAKTIETGTTAIGLTVNNTAAIASIGGTNSTNSGSFIASTNSGFGSGVFIFNTSSGTAFRAQSTNAAGKNFVGESSGGVDTFIVTDDGNIEAQGIETTGTRAGGNLIVKIGDYDDSGNTTKITIDDANLNVRVSDGVNLEAYQLIISTVAGGSAYIAASNVTTNRNFEFPDASGEIVVKVAAPATASSTGITGQVSWDTSYFYVCTATNTWKRTALATW